MKILYVWDIAGVSCVYAKYLRKLGHTCSVLSRAHQDTFKYLDFYNELSYPGESGAGFDDVAYQLAKDYDVIHMNAVWPMVEPMRKLYPDKKIIYEAHGSELRMGETPIRKVMENADKIVVATPDLQKYIDAEWLPQAVDTEHFKPSEHQSGAIFLKARYHILTPDDIPFPFTVIDRELHGIPHSAMPGLLKQFDTYVDVKYYVRFGYLQANSKTALEALATGMKVYSWEHKMLTELPDVNRPEYAVRNLERIYREL